MKNLPQHPAGLGKHVCRGEVEVAARHLVDAAAASRNVFHQETPRAGHRRSLDHRTAQGRFRGDPSVFAGCASTRRIFIFLRVVEVVVGDGARGERSRIITRLTAVSTTDDSHARGTDRFATVRTERWVLCDTSNLMLGAAFLVTRLRQVIADALVDDLADLVRVALGFQGVGPGARRVKVRPVAPLVEH